MDSRLLRHYEGELAFLREMGGEFSRAFPKIAARLGMEGLEVVDPYAWNGFWKAWPSVGAGAA